MTSGDALLAQTLGHLEALVACDTRNPPRAIVADGPLVSYLRAHLDASLRVDVIDHGSGCVSVLATRGAPRRLINVHLDTVPAVASWSSDPFRLRVDGDRAFALGAADTKGAAAALLAALPGTTGDAAILFTTDEEAGSSRCVSEFLKDAPRFDLALVSEPTRLGAVVAHRGIGSAFGVFSGASGHASSPRALADSAVHAAVRWGSRALELAEAEDHRAVGGLAGIRFNLGVLQGGHKSNVIADRAEVRFGVRPRPGESPDELLGRITALAPRASWQTTFTGPSLAPLPSTPSIEDHARALGLAVAAPVDYWTEAALFAAAGIPAIVFGPGDIAQAHAADEHVPLADLAAAARTYARLLGARA